MKKLLFVTEALMGGGAEAALVRLLNRLPGEFACTVVTVFPGGEELCKPNIRICCLNPRSSRLRFLWIRLLAQIGLAHRLWGSRDFDLHIAWMETFSTKLAASAPGPKIAWVHCDMKNRTHREKMTRWYGRFHRVVCVSRDVEASFRMYFDGNTEVVPNILETDGILEKSWEFQPETFDILAVGRLSPEKGFDRLLNAVTDLNRRGIFPSVGILGDGPLRKTLENQAESVPGVTFLGYRENPYPYIRAANILAIPSRSEGASTVAQEGMILGKAMVASPCAGMAEILGDCGLITEDLVAGIHCLLTDEEFRTRLAEKARRRGSEISPEGAAEAAASLLRRVMAEGGRK